MYALRCAPLLYLLRGNYVTAAAQAQELAELAEEKGASMWKAAAMVDQGFVLALTGNASDAIQMILSGITAWRAAGSTLNIPMFLLYLVRAYAELGQFEQARRTIGEAMTAIELPRRDCGRERSTELPGRLR
jgi:hypothetical protein